MPVVVYSPNVSGLTLTASRTFNPTFVKAQSPFLELPLEIRRLIYSYLIPDNKVYLYQPNCFRSQFTFRKDGSSCCPEILRVNRKLYTEVSLEWYSKAVFGVCIIERVTIDEKSNCYGVLSFLGKYYKSGDQLPRQLQQIKNLSLHLCLLKHALVTPGSNWRRGQVSLDKLDALVSLLCAPESKLENLALYVGTTDIVRRRMRIQPELNPEFMEARLHSLRKIRGLKEAKVRHNMGRVSRLELEMAASQTPNLDIDAWMHEFLDPLRKEMMEPKLL